MSLRDITEEEASMGGIPFVCAGDFRQIVAVIRGGKNDDLNYCIKNSYFLPYLVKLELTENVRLKKVDAGKVAFAKLLAIGSTLSGKVQLPKKFAVQVAYKKQLIENVYDDNENNIMSYVYFKKRAIISPTNVNVDKVNDIIYDQIEGKQVIYRSEDLPVDAESIEIQPPVYNGMKSPNLPLHELKLKVGCVIMVIRNINPTKICYGTRLIVTTL